MRAEATGAALARLAAASFLAAPPACDSGEPAPFEGARHADFPCLRERTAPPPEECRAIARALMDAYGGWELLERLRFSSEQDAYLLFGDIMSNHALQLIWFRSDAHFRQVRQFRGGTAQLLLSAGEPYLAVQGTQLQPARGEARQAVWWEYEVLDLPAGLLRDGAELRGLPPVEVEGRLLVPLELRDARPPALVVFVDPFGPVIRRVEASIPVEGDTISGSVFLERWVELSSFRRTQGVLFPWRMDHWTREVSGPVRQALVEVRSYRVEEDIPDDEFRPPS